MKYLVIGHKFGALGRGGYHISKRFCDEHPEHCEFKEDKKARNLENLNGKYKKLIFRTQVPRCYRIPVNFVRLRKINHLFYLRARYINPLYTNCTNGFHYFRMHEGFNNYIPMITDFPKIERPKEKCYGFYVRKWLTPDSYDKFIDILNNLKFKVNVTVMGDNSPEIKNHSNVLHYNHTNDNVQFFSEVTHYFYPTSRYFVDPFPHSVLEAIQTGKVVLFPKIERNFKDGIDDIKDTIGYGYNPLQAKIWKPFYDKVFANDWQYSFDRKRYTNLCQFIEGEVL